MEERHELKEASMAVISPIQATATAAAVRDDEGHACMMLHGEQAAVITLIENMAQEAIFKIYFDMVERGGDDSKALDTLHRAGELFHAHVMEGLLKRALRDKLKRACGGQIPEAANDAIEELLRQMDAAARRKDDEEEED